jgi:hypothetical protein
MTHRQDDDQQGGESRLHIRGLGPGDIALFRNLADEAADRAVSKTFIAMGLDPNKPLVSQRYFQVLRELTERSEQDGADAAWTHRWRLRTEGAVGKVLATVLGVAVLGAIGTFWTGFKAVVATPPPLPH